MLGVLLPSHEMLKRSTASQDEDMLIHEVSRISSLPTVESKPGSGCRSDVLDRLCFEWATKRKGYWGPCLIQSEDCTGRNVLANPL